MLTPCAFEMVVQRTALLTLKIFGITILLLFKSILLKTIPMFALEGLMVKFTASPLWSPTPFIEILFLIVFWFKTDIL